MGRATRLAAIVSLIVALVVLAGAWLDHVIASREGGLEVALSNAGCLGGVPRDQVGNCGWIEWSYRYWFVIPLGTLVLGVGVTTVVWWVSRQQYESQRGTFT